MSSITLDFGDFPAWLQTKKDTQTRLRLVEPEATEVGHDRDSDLHYDEHGNQINPCDGTVI